MEIVAFRSAKEQIGPTTTNATTTMSPRQTTHDDWDEDEDNYDAEYDPDEDDFNRDEEEPTVPCPYCKREIHEDANQCPYCEQYISKEDAPRRKLPWWIIVGLIACFYAIWTWLW